MPLINLFSPVISWIQESVSHSITGYAVQGNSGIEGIFQPFNDENDTFHNIKDITDLDFNEDSEEKLTVSEASNESKENVMTKSDDNVECLADNVLEDGNNVEIFEDSCEEHLMYEEVDDSEEEDFVSIKSEDGNMGEISPYRNDQSSIFDMYKRSSVINKKLSEFNSQFSTSIRKYSSAIRKPLVTKEEIRALTRFYKEINPNYTPSERRKIIPRSEEEREAVADTLRFVEWYKSKFS